MNSQGQTTDSNLAVFFFGAVFNLLATISNDGLAEYTMQAVIGGLIWLAFKLAGDFITEKMKKRK